MLKSISKKPIGFLEMAAAYDSALEFKKSTQLKLKKIYKRRLAETGKNIHVVLLGRPYTVLCPHMNKGIPDIFASLGIKAFYQDMLSYNRQDVASIQPYRWRITEVDEDGISFKRLDASPVEKTMSGDKGNKKDR